MTTVKEKTLEAKFVRLCKADGWLTWKLSSPARRGVPDRIVMAHGRVAFVELKRPGNRPTVLQERTLRELRSHDLPAQWFDDVDKAGVWLHEVLGA